MGETQSAEDHGWNSPGEESGVVQHAENVPLQTSPHQNSRVSCLVGMNSYPPADRFWTVLFLMLKNFRAQRTGGAHTLNV